MGVLHVQHDMHSSSTAASLCNCPTEPTTVLYQVVQFAGVIVLAGIQCCTTWEIGGNCAFLLWTRSEAVIRLGRL